MNDFYEGRPMTTLLPGDRVKVIGEIFQWMYDGLGAGPWKLVIEKLTTTHHSGHSRDLYIVKNLNNYRSTGIYRFRLEPIESVVLPNHLFTID